MNAIAALARLRALGVPVVATADVAACLQQSPFAASKTLTRLARAGLIANVRHGVWWLEPPIDRYRVAEHLTAPMPSYLSLQTALHLHGMIEQIPEVVYAATLGKTQRIVTPVGSYSFHHLAPEIFGGFAETDGGTKLASPEKALFDVAYLAGGRSRRFTALPELELPRGFRRRELAGWLGRIPDERRRKLVAARLDRMLPQKRRQLVPSGSR